jgi:DNA-binding response OmpR family regulator
MLPAFLLLEDSYSDVQAMTALFKRIGLANPVRVIGTVADAQRHLTESAPERLPVIVFVGAQVRGVHGLDLLDWMRQQDALSRVAAIALVDVEDGEAAARAAELGVSVVEKPVEMRALITAMRALGLAEKAKIDRMTLTVQVELYPSVKGEGG